MMKVVRLQMWMIGLIALAFLMAALGFAALVEHAAVDRLRAGPIADAALSVARLPAKAKGLLGRLKKRDLEARDQRFAGASGFERLSPGADGGLLLLARHDRDRQRSVVEVVRLADWTVLHTYAPDIAALNARSDLPAEAVNFMRDKNPRRYLMNHPVIEADGDLIFHGVEAPLAKIDICSNIIWTVDRVFHHSIERGPDGNYWTSALRIPPKLKAVTENFRDEVLIKVSPEGEILFERALGDILIENGRTDVIYGHGPYQRDPLHINDIQPALADGPFWKRGDLFLSLRHRSMVMIYRPSTNEIPWMKFGPWMMQHDVDILDDHRIAVFSNNTGSGKWGDRSFGGNETLVYDFAADEIASPFAEAYQRHEVRTLTEGLQEFLADGGLLVEEQNYGRLLKFGRDGEIDWRFVNRASDGRVYFVSWSRYIPPEDAPAIIETIKSADCDRAGDE